MQSKIIGVEPCRSRRHAFTLIELLIVVAIIAILAAIAVPNFLEAQVRAKISRAKSDMRAVATAIEAYAVDNNTRYPFGLDAGVDNDGYNNLRYYGMLTIPDAITTPIGYITGHLPDVFKNGAKETSLNPTGSAGRPFQSGDPQDMTFMWLAMRQAGPGAGDPGLGYGFFTSAASWEAAYNVWGEWRMASIGPRQRYPGDPDYPGSSFTSINSNYDPTNGTVSLGLVIRNQRSTDGNK
jgi:prepilin-type N-terminal cleavage/methylation domain-containing protein